MSLNIFPEVVLQCLQYHLIFSILTWVLISCLLNFTIHNEKFLKEISLTTHKLAK